MKHVLIQELQKGRVSFCPVGRWLTAGRSSKRAELVFKDKHVSRAHCRIKGRTDGGIEVTDESQFGTTVDGRRIEGTAIVKPGQELVLGTSFRLRVVGLLDDDVSHADEDEPRPPRRLGASAILLREVGRGGMGVVYESWDERAQRRCALKWLRSGGRATPERIERFQREAMLQGRLSDYPGIVTIYDLGVLFGSGELYCVLEYVDGESLLQKMKRGVERAEAVRIVARAARACAYAHRQGVLHRDVKPANILISRSDQVRLTDFGIARAMDVGGGMTLTGIMLGTPGYMAPEQIRDAKRVTEAADVYALGATLYSAITNKLPIKGKSMQDALRRVAAGTLAPGIKSLADDIDEVLEAAVMRALAFEPEERWGSPDLFADELERWLERHAPAAKVELRGP